MADHRDDFIIAIRYALLKKGAKLLEGIHDFSTFRAASCSAKSAIKKMNYVKIKNKMVVMLAGVLFIKVMNRMKK